MIDFAGPKGRIVEAAFDLAGTRPWRDITVLDISEGAGVSLAAFRKEFAGKAAILAHFIRALDDAVVAKAPAGAQGESAKDRLFEVIMNRFDAMAPHKAGLKSIAASGFAEPPQIRAVLSSQAWMLQAAGIGAEGVRGGLRVAGLASVYATVFQTWLDDDDPGLARTMAALDRRLRRAESAVSRMDNACTAVAEFAARLRSPLGRPDHSGPRPASASGSAGNGAGADPTVPPADQPAG